MPKINVFLGTAGQVREHQRVGLLAFYRALRNAGEDVSLVTESVYRPCDIAVVYGCPKVGGQAKVVRCNVYAAHEGSFVVLETPFLGRRVYHNDKGLRAFIRRLRNKRTAVDTRTHFRVGLNGAFHNTADFVNAGSPPDRWELLRREFGLALKPYRRTGSHVLIVGQVPNDASLQGADIVAWMNATAREVKRHTDRPIVLRPHPCTRPDDLRRMAQSFEADRQVRIDVPPTGTIQDALADCWIAVTYSSSSSVDALLAGVPALTMSAANIAWPVTDHDLAKLENPTLHPREQWLYDLCYAQWSPAEIESGIVWARLKGRAYQHLEQHGAEAA